MMMVNAHCFYTTLTGNVVDMGCLGDGACKSGRGTAGGRVLGGLGRGWTERRSGERRQRDRG